MTTRFTDHLLAGDHASLPAFGDVPQGTLYACSTHDLIYQSDGSTAWSTWADVSGSGSGFVNGAYDIERRTAGDLSITSTSAGAAVPTIGNNVVAAASGDLLLIGISATIDNALAQRLRMDVATIVSAAVVNYLSSLSGTPATAGVSAWGALASTETRVGTPVPYVVQAGDISGGNVELSLRAWNAGAGTRGISATATAPFLWWVKNLGQ